MVKKLKQSILNKVSEQIVTQRYTGHFKALFKLFDKKEAKTVTTKDLVTNNILIETPTSEMIDIFKPILSKHFGNKSEE